MKKLTEDLLFKISKDRSFGTKDLSVVDIYDSDTELIWDMLRISTDIRGYEYIKSFKKYYALHGSLAPKQMYVLRSNLFREIAYELYCNKKLCSKGLPNIIVPSSCNFRDVFFKPLSSKPKTSVKVNDLFERYLPANASSVLLFDTGSEKYSLGIEEEYYNYPVAPNDFEFYFYTVDKESLVVAPDSDTKYYNKTFDLNLLNKAVEFLIKESMETVGLVDLVRVERNHLKKNQYEYSLHLNTKKQDVWEVGCENCNIMLNIE